MKHLYGIISAENSDQGLRLAPPVYGVREGSLTAVVSDTDITDYRTLPQEELRQHLRQHQEIIESILPHATILPMQFGSLLETDAQIRAMLSSHHQTRLDKTWRDLEGFIQMELVLLWEANTAVEQLSQELNIPQIQAEMATQSPDEQRRTQMEVGRMIQVGLARKQNELEQLVRDELEGIAQNIIKNSHMDEGMAVNLAVLLRQADSPAFEAALRRLDEKTGGAYLIRAVGPLPPHSFVQVTVKLPQLHHIEHARELLGLGQTSTLADIKKAYQNHAYYTQPDRNSGLGTVIKMTELAQCYKLLRELALNQGGETCRLDEAAVAETIILTIQKPE